MVSKVSFGFDDGSTLIRPDSSMLIFIDETGHEGLRDREFPIFGYGGCLTLAVDYENAIVKPWKAVEHIFPSDMLPLHASELPRDRLTSVHYEAFNGFFSKNVFGRFAAICTNKTVNARPEYETITYMTAVLHKRILDILRRILNHGLAFSEVVMIIERSERTKYMVTQNFSQYELQFMSHTIPIHRYFMTKAPGEPGLVVADFIAHTAGSTVRDKLTGKISQYLKRRDFKNVFTTQDDRWVSFIEVNDIK